MSHLLYLLAVQIWLHVSAQDCLRPAYTNDSLPSFENLERDAERIDDSNRAQVIVTSYQFHCCGNITGWQTHVEPDGGRHQNGAYSINFQVWRPSPTVGSDGAGEYSLVGENRFTSIMFDDGSPISETPEPTNMISVRPGDVVGYFLSSTEGGNDGIQLVSSFSNSRQLWYQTEFTDGIPSTIAVGSAGTLRSSTNAGIILSVGIDSSSCPTPTPTPPPTMPTTVPPTTPAPLTDSPTFPPATTELPPTEPPPTNPAIISTTTAPQQPSLEPDHTTADTDGATPPVSSSVNAALAAALAVVMVILVVGVCVIVVFVIIRKHHHSKKLGIEKSSTDLQTGYHYITDIQQTKLPPTKPKKPPLPLHSQPPHPSSPTNTYSAIGSTSIGNQGNNSQDYYSSVGASIDTTPGYDKVVSVQVKERTFNGYSYDRDLHRSDYNTLSPEYYFNPIYYNQEGDDGAVYAEPTVEEHDSKLSSFASIGEVVPSQRDRRVLSEKERKPNPYNQLNFFMDDSIYWTPGTTTSEIYDQLSSKNYREIYRSQIKILNHLGSGQFGTVSKGEWRVSKHSLAVAVKQLLPTASSTERVKLLQEAAIMGQFTHPNVVKLYGLVTVNDPLMVCIEYMDKGDLKSYLEKMDLRNPDIGSCKDVPYFFLKASNEIVSGMNYLSKKGFVHRDLAARNILLSKALTCKIGDFGLARDLTDDTYYTAKPGGVVPVRWTAPEALHYKKYSSDSDVWSYAMVLFEIWSVGKRPFSTMSNLEVIRVLQGGYCQAPPPGCPRAIYKLMVDCWNPEHHLRPKFQEIWNYLQQPLSKLLYWSPQDTSMGGSAEKLGAPLNCAHNLYLDLQNHYSKMQQKYF